MEKTTHFMRVGVPDIYIQSRSPVLVPGTGATPDS
jgi:hypothetical protein